MAFRKVVIIGLFFWLNTEITLILKIKKKSKIYYVKICIIAQLKIYF